jgi:hypothetical protein
MKKCAQEKFTIRAVRDPIRAVNGFLHEKYAILSNKAEQ